MTDRNPAANTGRKRIAILGCTGSIGTQALDVCRRHADRLEVVALTAHSRTRELVDAAREFGVARVAVTDAARRSDPALADLPAGTSCQFGAEAAVDVCLHDDVDCVLVAIVGAAGLAASAAVLASGKQLALANKESLVVGGELLMPLAREGQLIPVDSEHSAIFQCYMGAKITVDSATLMNKGLERIEAMHLFGVDMDFIRVVIQRQSKIHSMVEYEDGSVIAHLGASDMRIPIQYAFSYPDRWETPAPRVDFRELGSLDFAAPDADAFRCLALAERAGRTGGTLPCVMNAANEVAVAAFLDGAIGFTDIDRVVETCMDAHAVEPVQTLEQLADVDASARDAARRAIRARR